MIPYCPAQSLATPVAATGYLLLATLEFSTGDWPIINLETVLNFVRVLDGWWVTCQSEWSSTLNIPGRCLYDTRNISWHRLSDYQRKLACGTRACLAWPVTRISNATIVSEIQHSLKGYFILRQENPSPSQVRMLNPEAAVLTEITDFTRFYHNSTGLVQYCTFWRYFTPLKPWPNED